MDNLTACAIAAQRAGMSYGQFMATRPQPVRIVQSKPEIKKPRICKNCGKEFDASDRSANALYCDPMCYREALTIRSRERERAKKNISNDDILICPQCGIHFVRGDRHAGIKYCSEECAAERKRERRRTNG